jgi:GNAT superfamily N-acetyltransferase
MTYSTRVEIQYRSVNRDDLNELRFIAEKDSKIPKLYEAEFPWNEKSIDGRLELYNRLSASEDFFEVALQNGKIIAFHIIKKAPFPPDLYMGLIITLWVEPEFRGKGVATAIKSRGERWAKTQGLDHLQTGVHATNSKMISINEKSGFQTFQFNMKKKL